MQKEIAAKLFLFLLWKGFYLQTKLYIVLNELCWNGTKLPNTLDTLY